MSDAGDRDRGRRSRRRRGGLPERPVTSSRKERDYEADSAPAKPPIILAKPAHEQPHGGSPSSTSSSVGSKTPDKTVVMMRSREEGRTASTSSISNIPAAVTGETTSTQPLHPLQRNPSAPVLSLESTLQNKLAAPPEMTHCVQLIDESLQWIENGSELLLDQTDFFVIGVIGLQGTGKSTVMSLLAGNSPNDLPRQFVFQPQDRAIREMCEHQTVGIDMFVTGERVIFLDSQPVLSSSVLDRLIRNDKKIPAEYSTAENCIEMQSLQQAAFLMTVCHVVLVVQDWFIDTSLIRFLQTAEMLKPSTPSSNHDSNSSSEDTHEYSPNIVFIQNKAARDDFSAESYNLMQQSLLKVFESSDLKLTGSVTMANGKILPGLNSKSVDTDVNLYLLPVMDSQRSDTQDTILTLLPEYRGYPSFATIINRLRQQIYSMHKSPLTQSSLSEKNWFHYAARIWDSVKKSQLMSEYNRLLN